MTRRWIPLLLVTGACAGSSTSTTTATPSATVPGAAWPDEGPATWTPRPTETGITANDLRTRLYQFADDSMHGRRIGEPGNYTGTAYIAHEFQRLGLKPGGDNGTYFQNLPFGPAGFALASSSLSVNGTAITPKSDWIPIAPSAQNGVGNLANFTNVPAVYAGRLGDESVTLDPGVFRGKIAVLSATPATAGLLGGRGGGRGGMIPRCDSVPDKFGAAAAARVEAEQRAAGQPAARGGRGGGAERDTRAQQAGAAGVLLVALDESTTGAADAAFTPRMMMQPSFAAGSIPSAAISEEAARKIFGRDVSQIGVGTVGQPISAHWSYDFKISDTPGRNVIAIVPGSDPAKAGEYVLVGAHNDHVGVNSTPVEHDSLRAVNTVTRRQGANDPVCRPTDDQWTEINRLIAHARAARPPRLDSIMNGADDDGSGTVILLEVAERFAKEKPARSIIFVSHEGEEAGLLGSRWFTDHPTIPLNQIAAALNMDMEAKGHPWQVINGAPNSIQTLGSRRLSREFGDIVDSVATNPKNPMAIDHTWDVPANPMNRFCRSDQVNYVHHDVPVTYFSTGYAQDYHQATDEPRYADYDHMAKIGTFIHDIMWAIAQRPNRPAITGADPNYPRCR